MGDERGREAAAAGAERATRQPAGSNFGESTRRSAPIWHLDSVLRGWSGLCTFFLPFPNVYLTPDNPDGGLMFGDLE